jgi:hypothetical protein
MRILGNFYPKELRNQPNDELNGWASIGHETGIRAARNLVKERKLEVEVLNGGAEIDSRNLKVRAAFYLLPRKFDTIEWPNPPRFTDSTQPSPGKLSLSNLRLASRLPSPASHRPDHPSTSRMWDALLFCSLSLRFVFVSLYAKRTQRQRAPFTPRIVPSALRTFIKA